MATKTIYRYDPTTKEYLSSEFMDANTPTPDFATTIAPGQAQQNVAYVFNTQLTQWDAEQDYRGVDRYSTTDGRRERITTLGPVGQGYTLTAPPDLAQNYPTLCAWTGQQWAQPQNNVTGPIMSAAFRLQRNILLADTDFVVLSDCPVDPTCKNLFTTYRQALRDIPQQQGYPQQVNWPTKPTYVKAS